MTTTHPPHDTRPLAPAVVALRPRSLARRAAALRERVGVRRAAGVPHEELLLEVVDGVLARTHRVSAGDLDVWARLVALAEEHADISPTLPACATAANLVGLAVFGDDRDVAALVGLVDELGPERVARLQHRYGGALETDSRLPLTTAALRRMLASGPLGRRSTDAAHGPAFGDTCLRAAHALLVQGVDRAWTVPTLESVEELVDITTHGTVNEWRHHVAMLMSEPWSAYSDRLLELARRCADPSSASVVRAVVELCRDQAPTGRHRGATGHALAATPYLGSRAAP